MKIQTPVRSPTARRIVKLVVALASGATMGTAAITLRDRVCDDLPVQIAPINSAEFQQIDETKQFLKALENIESDLPETRELAARELITFAKSDRLPEEQKIKMFEPLNRIRWDEHHPKIWEIASQALVTLLEGKISPENKKEFITTIVSLATGEQNDKLITLLIKIIGSDSIPLTIKKDSIVKLSQTANGHYVAILYENKQPVELTGRRFIIEELPKREFAIMAMISLFNNSSSKEFRTAALAEIVQATNNKINDLSRASLVRTFNKLAHSDAVSAEEKVQIEQVINNH